MNPDPVYQKLREISWRRALTEAEQAEWRAWLLAHPETQAEAEADAVLNAALAKLPDAPMPSNFTARVWQTIELEKANTTHSKPQPAAAWWRALLPRLAVACVVVLGGLGLWQQQRAKQKDLTHVAREVASANLLSNPSVLSHFDEIVSLTPPEASPDEALLAMSEDLMALSK
jgi:plasmid stability protein